MSYKNSENGQIDPLPEKFDIVYGRQIEYHSIPNKILTGESLSLSCEPHPMIVLMVVSSKGDDEGDDEEIRDDSEDTDEGEEVFYVVGVFGQTVRNGKFDYYNVAENDLILKKNAKNNLSDTTIFRFHAKNINILKYSKEFFEKRRGAYLIGSLGNAEIDSIRNIFEKFPEVNEIISYIITNEIPILPLKLHTEEKYELLFTTKTEKINK